MAVCPKQPNIALPLISEHCHCRVSSNVGPSCYLVNNGADIYRVTLCSVIQCIYAMHSLNDGPATAFIIHHTARHALNSPAREQYTAIHEVLKHRPTHKCGSFKISI